MGFNILFIIIPVVLGAILYVYIVDGSILSRNTYFDDEILVEFDETKRIGINKYPKFIGGDTSTVYNEEGNYLKNEKGEIISKTMLKKAVRIFYYFDPKLKKEREEEEKKIANDKEEARRKYEEE